MAGSASGRRSITKPGRPDGDNVYEVSVVAYSGELSDTQAFSITIGNDYEPVTSLHGGGIGPRC